MTSMFPRPGHPDNGNQDADRPGPRDYNRPTRPAQEVDPNHAPAVLRWAYWVLVVAAIVMLTSAMVGIFGEAGSQHLPASEAVAEYLRTNRYFVAISNMVAAVIIALIAAQLTTGSRWPRRIITVVIAFTLFSNIAALALGVGGLALLFIPMLLMVALVLLYRPAANRFINSHNYASFK